MTAKTAVQDFVDQRSLAVVGVSRTGRKFGNMAYRELKARGYQLIPIHPEAETVEGDRTYPSLKSLPELVDGVLIIVPPERTEQVVREAAAAGIKQVWMRQGAESSTAINFCKDNGISEVHGECIMMFARDTAFYHRMHRWVWGLLGKLPQ
ncbi:MAG: CoA-binding protein [Anaerolineales bacterium]|nr:CoA-binding protein [Anaerolineales bacterium]